MGAEGAVEVLHGKELKDADDRPARFAQLCERYRDEYMSVKLAAERGWIDEVIAPDETRRKIAHYLELLEPASAERTAQGNIPL
jgi:acetyl-CoA carboxylase carboxyltransferase component